MISQIISLNESYFGQPGKVYKFNMTIQLIIGLVISIIGLYFLSEYKHPSVYKSLEDYGLILWSIIFFSWGFWYLLKWYSYRGYHIQVYEKGLIIYDNKSNKTTIHWTDINEIKQRIVKGIINTSYQYTLLTTDGLSLYIPNYVKDINELMELIYNNTYKNISFQFNSKYDEGSKTFFGELVIDKNGITINKINKFVSWNDVNKVQIKDGKIVIFKSKLIPWKSIPRSSVSNYPILISFLKEKIGTNFHIISEKELTFFQSPQLSNPFKVPPIVKK